MPKDEGIVAPIILGLVLSAVSGALNAIIRSEDEASGSILFGIPYHGYKLSKKAKKAIQRYNHRFLEETKKMALEEKSSALNTNPNLLLPPQVRVQTEEDSHSTLIKDVTVKEGELSYESAMPVWLNRCSEPGKRVVLFSSGVILVLVSLVCFGPAKKSDVKSF